MKPIRLLALSLVTTLTASAQTNSYPFPASGNVGIGTTNPSDKLHVVGADWSGIVLEHAATGGVGTLKWSPNGVYGPRFLMLSNETPTTAGSGQDGGIMFRVNHGPTSGHTDPAMVISPFGNVGIGTTSPIRPLHVMAPYPQALFGGVDSGGANGLFIAGCSISTKRNWLVGCQYNADQSFEITPSSENGGQVFPIPAFVVTSSGNVGIGATNPASKLDIYENGQHLTFLVNKKLTGSWPAADEATTMTIQSSGVSAGNLAWATGNTEQMRITQGGNVGIGTTNPTHKLAVNGMIKAKEVIVETTGWSDHVFADDYTLQPLSEIETHIKINKHLPGIPSASEVAAQGVSVGDMQAKLLAKVEELTLHIIAQEKKIAAMQSQLQELQTR